MKTPKTSKLFEKRINPDTGVEYYVLSTKVCKHQQAFYFVNDSMTRDGRYLWFRVNVNPIYDGLGSHLAYVDFETDEIVVCYDVYGGGNSFIDPDTGDAYFTVGKKLYVRSPRKDRQARLVCTANLNGDVRGIATHLTRSSDKKHFFLDVRISHTINMQGLLDIETGNFEKWTEAPHCTNHGQLNPCDDTVGLCAYEYTSNPETGAAISVPKDENGIYARMWIVNNKGERRMLPPLHNYATHEWWSADGKKVYYCCDNYGLYGVDIATGKDVIVLDNCDPWHAYSTRDDRYFIFDEKKLDRYGGKWYRGCPAGVNLFDSKTGKLLKIVEEMPENGHTPENPNNYHIDPHPRFVGDEKYVVFTTTELGGVDLAIADMSDLCARLEKL